MRKIKRIHSYKSIEKVDARTAQAGISVASKGTLRAKWILNVNNVSITIMPILIPVTI